MGDVKNIAEIINTHAKNDLMLPISLIQIYDQIRDFIVAEVDGEIAGCGAIHVVWENLGEIRSVAVKESCRKNGIGTLLAEKLIRMALEIGIRDIFVLTYQKTFFEKFGFSVIEKETLPHKIWNVCINCSKFPNCDETAMIKKYRDE